MILQQYGSKKLPQKQKSSTAKVCRHQEG